MPSAEPAVDRMGAEQRRRLQVTGIVQGVGFRPFVYRLATGLGLRGWVRNDERGVALEVQGPAAALDALARRLRAEAPPLARVDHITQQPAAAGPPLPLGFEILASSGSGGPAQACAGQLDAAVIGPDTAPCEDCVAELLDPRNRRWRHAFINCTQCGPRFTITRRLPYDRAATTMAGFAACAACRAEYLDPGDRRFHAEPIACPACGPRLAWRDAQHPLQPKTPEPDPLAAAAAALRQGRIVAVKGVGGFQLVCDARQADAVAALRQRKGRDEKPFAVMVADLAGLAGLAHANPDELARLQSPDRPIILLPKAPGCDQVLPGVAPGLAFLGVMLPSSPLHLLLFHEAAGRPAGWSGAASPLAPVWVVTSANPGGEPIAVGNAEAQERLAGLADGFLQHDRDIAQRCDDSVLRRLDGLSAPAFQFIRRARGAGPQALRLASGGLPVLALGGHLKTTACVFRGDEAFISAHVGSLDNAATCRALDEAVAHLLQLLRLRPQTIAHDLHPDSYSTRLAERLAAEHGARLYPVQHHHAHAAAVLAEHRIEAPAVALVVDGVGLGADGTAWGGELLRVAGAQSQRLGHLSLLRLPGGDRAAREPWRVATAVLADAGRADAARDRFGDTPRLRGVLGMLEKGLNCPASPSLGRWFDAAAGVLGVAERNAFEGQAAMRLEALALAWGDCPPEPEALAWSAAGPDLSPLLLALADEPDPARGAARFHATLAWALAEWVIGAARGQGLRHVVAAGGCMVNRLLSRALGRRVVAAGLHWLQAQQAPPNDGGLALGQAWVARHADNC